MTRLVMPITANESVHTQTMAQCHITYEILKARPTPAPRTAPLNSASPELSKSRVWVADHVFIVRFPGNTHPPLLLRCALSTQPNPSLDQHRPRRWTAPPKHKPVVRSQRNIGKTALSLFTRTTCALTSSGEIVFATN